MASSPTQLAHDPFVLRWGIFLGALPVGFVGGAVAQSYTLGFVLYCLMATLLDFLVQSVFSLKSSDFADPGRLLSHEGVSGPELDRYHRSRYQIRLISLGSALVSQLFYPSLPLFCSVYALTTILGVLYVRFLTDIKTPRLFQARPLTLKELNTWEPDNTYNDIALGYLGIGPYAFLKRPDSRDSVFRSDPPLPLPDVGSHRFDPS